MAIIETFLLYFGMACLVSATINRSFYSNNIMKRNFFLMFSLFVPSMIAALRKDTGTDSYNYQKIYENINSVVRYVDIEVGYKWLMKVLKHCQLPYQVLFFVMAFFTMFFLYLTLNREKDYIDVNMAAFMIMIDFYFMTFNAMRQFLSIAIGLYAFSLFVDKKYYKSLILIILACLFHRSALLCLVIILGKVLFDNKYSKFFIVVTCIVILYLIYHRDLLGAIVLLITRSNYYVAFITRNVATKGTVFKYFFKNSPMLFITTLSYQNYRKCRHMQVLFALMLSGYLFSALGYITLTQVQRVGYYLSYLNIIVVSFCVKHDLRMGRFLFRKEYFKIILYSYLVVIFIYNYFYAGYMEVVPYRGFSFNFNA